MMSTLGLDWWSYTDEALDLFEESLEQAKKDIAALELKLEAARASLANYDYEGVEKVMREIQIFLKSGKVF